MWPTQRPGPPRHPRAPLRQCGPASGQTFVELADIILGALAWPRFTINQIKHFEARQCMVWKLKSPSVFLAGKTRGESAEFLWRNHNGPMTHTYNFSAVLLVAALGLLAGPRALAQTPPPKATSTASAKSATMGTPPSACPAILKHQFLRLQDDAPQNLCQYAGKVVLVVNTASFCGFTTQYEGLEALYAKYQAQGLVVLGFPSNEFGEQEPGSAKEIADFCFNTYGVKFPMFSKSEVAGKKRNPLYAELFKATSAEPKWNFHKFLIDRSGKVAANYTSNVEPDNTQLVSAIQKALGAKL